MNDTLCRVIMRFADEAATPAFQAPTIVRISPNAITAVAIPSIVSTVRSRCRNTFLKTILTSFTAGPSLQLTPVGVAPDVRPPDGGRGGGPPHHGLLEFLVSPLD